MNNNRNKLELEENGFSICPPLYAENEVNQILACIDKVNQSGNSFRKSKDLFAIRQLFKNIPELTDLLFTDRLIELIKNLSESQYFLTKAIYFDKPSESNWFVAYHQDLSISVDRKADIENYVNWTFKKGQYGVQPPIKILKDTITIRIHLDKTTKDNGALMVIPKSHVEGITRVEKKEWNTKSEISCDVEKGGVMLMNPLTLHASNRTTNGKRRRVIHLELNKHRLDEPLSWLEYNEI